MKKVAKVKKEGSILWGGLELIFSALEKLSLGKAIEKDRPRRLEIYVLSWLVAEIITLVTVAFIPAGKLAWIFIFVLFSYRLFEVFITAFNAVIISVMEGKKTRSIPRVFIFVLLNYIEVMIIFAVFYFFLLEGASMMKSLNYSVSLATLSGITFDMDKDSLYLAGIIEMLLGIFFIAGALAALVNYLGSRE